MADKMLELHKRIGYLQGKMLYASRDLESVLEISGDEMSLFAKRKLDELSRLLYDSVRNPDEEE